MTVDIATSTPRVVALAARTGRQLWTRDVDTPDTGSANLAYDGGRLFVFRNTYTNHEAPSLLALSPDDGRTLWEAGPPNVFEASAPVAAGGAVYVSWGRDGEDGVSAWRQSDGAMLWSTSTEDKGVGGSPAVWGDDLLLGIGCPPQLIRLRRTDGSLHEPLPNDACTSGGDSTPVVVGRRVYLSWEPGVYDAASGSLLRAIDDDLVVAATPSLQLDARAKRNTALVPRPWDSIVARRPRDGRRLWRFRADRRLTADALIVGATVYVGSGSGRLYAIDAGTGRRRWRGRVGAPVYGGGLAAAAGLLLVPARNRLVAFEGARRE